MKRLFFILLLLTVIFYTQISKGYFFPRGNTSVQLLQNQPYIITHGPIFGSVTDTSADIWVRIVTSRNAVVKVIASPHTEYVHKSTLSKTITTTLYPISADSPYFKWDFTWKGILSGLSSYTMYDVNISVNGENAPISTYTDGTYPRFKTFARRGQPTNFNVVFYTDFYWKGNAIYNTFQNIKYLEEDDLQPSIIFLGGDLWHDDTAELSNNAEEFVTFQRELFKWVYGINSGIFSLFHNDILSRYPLVHIMDDHDMGMNNTDRNYQYKTQALQVLREYFPTYPLPPSGNGFWQKFSYGQADFFLLDVRSQRSPIADTNSDLNKTMLGKEQLQWLKQSLLQSKATWKFIYTGVVFNSTLGKTDSWMGYTKERTELVQFLKGQSADNTSPITGVIFISGDAHGGAIDDGTNADFPEMLVPGPEARHCWTTAEVGKWSHGYYSSPHIGGGEYSNPPCPGFGIVNIYTNPDRIDLIVKDDQGMTKLFYRHFLNQSDEKNYLNLPDEK